MKAERDEAYILHRRSFKESSVVMECLTRREGWISIVARGAKRARSRFDALLQPFVPLELEWGGRSELKTLYKAESKFFFPLLKQEKLLLGLYLNELIFRLLQRGDPHPTLFEVYDKTLQKLNHLTDEGLLQGALRQFEIQLLSELGYGLFFKNDQSGCEIQPDLLYSYDPKTGIYEISAGSMPSNCVVSGASLLALSRDQYDSEALLLDAKRFMRFVLSHYLGDKPLATRKLYVKNEVKA